MLPSHQNVQSSSTEDHRAGDWANSLCPPGTPPKPEDWMNWRPVITYLHRTLPTYERISEYMSENYSFTASVSSFRHHFRAWGLQKKASKADILYLAMVRRDLELKNLAACQRPKFWVHDRLYRYSDVQRAMKRFGIKEGALGPTSRQPSHIRIELHDVEPYPPLSTPPHLALPEKTLRETAIIYSLPSIHDRPCAANLRRGQEAYRWALQAINQKRWEDSEGHLNTSLVYLGEAFKQRSLHLLPLICFATIQAQLEPCPIARFSLERFLKRSLLSIEYYYSKEHPFVLTLGCLISTVVRANTSLLILRQILDLLYAKGIQLIDTTEEVEVILTDTLRNLGEMDLALAVCRRIVDDRERQYSPFHPKILVARNTLANCYLRQGDFTSAEKILHGTLDAENSAPGRWRRDFPFFEALRLKALTSSVLSGREEGERMVNQAVKELQHVNIDADDAETILHGIARMMDQVGYCLRADWLRSRINMTVYSFATELPSQRCCYMYGLVSEYFLAFPNQGG